MCPPHSRARFQRAPASIDGADNAGACAVDGVVFIAVPYEGLDDIVGGLVRADRRPHRGQHRRAGAVREGRGVQRDRRAGGVGVRADRRTTAGRARGRRAADSQPRDPARPRRSGRQRRHPHRRRRGGQGRRSRACSPRSTALRLVDGGALRNSRFVEQLTVLLLSINRRYRRHTGVRITDLDDDLSLIGTRPPGDGPRRPTALGGAGRVPGVARACSASRCRSRATA